VFEVVAHICFFLLLFLVWKMFIFLLLIFEEKIMLFILVLSYLSTLVASQRNCATGVNILNGETTIGAYYTSFSLGAGQSVCLHTTVTSSQLSTPSTVVYGFSIDGPSNSRLVPGAVPSSNSGGDCAGFTQVGNVVSGSPTP
jgi:hypothetical protein